MTLGPGPETAETPDPGSGSLRALTSEDVAATATTSSDVRVNGGVFEPATIRTARLVLEPAGLDVARAVRAGEGPPAARGWPGAEALSAFRFAVDFGGDPGWLILRDDLVVGECGTHGPPDPDGVVEIRYGIAVSERGRGLGTEACAALTAWLLDRPGVARVAASTDAAANLASRRVLERSGFVLDRLDGATAWYVRSEQTYVPD